MRWIGHVAGVLAINEISKLVGSEFLAGSFESQCVELVQFAKFLQRKSLIQLGGTRGFGLRQPEQERNGRSNDQQGT